MIPILVPTPSGKSTGMLFLDGEAVYVCEVPEDALDVFTDDDRRRKFERLFGKASESRYAGVKAALLLIQAIEDRDPRRVREYASWQAVAEYKAEQEMADRLVRSFKTEGAHELSVIARTVREQSEMTVSEERHKLLTRVSGPNPLVAVSELLMQLNRWIRGAHFVLYFDRAQEKTLPGLFCPDVGTALAALVFDRIPSSRGVGVCKRCGKPFLRTKPGQRYHSLQCGNADRKARERTRRRRK